jgi:hypothetical protein
MGLLKSVPLVGIVGENEVLLAPYVQTYDQILSITTSKETVEPGGSVCCEYGENHDNTQRPMCRLLIDESLVFVVEVSSSQCANISFDSSLKLTAIIVRSY